MVNYLFTDRHGLSKQRIVLSWKVLSASVGVFVSLSLFCMGCGKGDGVEALIVGNSMAPTLWGESRSAMCDECGYVLRFSIDQNPLPSQTVCPNCGFRCVDALSGRQLSADRVEVVRSAMADYQRWDVVATRPGQGQPAVVKRLVGMPNESIEFCNGDVWADGKIVRKPLAVARKMRVPVFDSAFKSKEVERRLRPVATPSGWSADAGGWQYVSGQAFSDPETIESRRLRYHQWRGVNSGLPRDADVWVEDWYAANVSANRDLHRTNDLWMEVTCSVKSGGQFELQIEQGSTQFLFHVDDSTNTVSHAGRSHTLKQPPGGPAGTVTYQVDACTFDRRLTLWVNGLEVLEFDLPVAEANQVPKFPIQIIGQASDLEVSRFRLWRDVYYFDSMANRASSGAALLATGSDEFILVGDNVPESVDSRHWPKPAVPAVTMLGKVRVQETSETE